MMFPSSGRNEASLIPVEQRPALGEEISLLLADQCFNRFAVLYGVRGV